MKPEIEKALEQEVHIANFSGGRSSALMVRLLAENGAPIDEVNFCDTSMESGETHLFIRAVAEQWFEPLGIKLNILSYKDDHSCNVGTLDDLKSDGAAMGRLLQAHPILPNPRARRCTIGLKINVSMQYAYSKYGRYAYYISYIGMRADERERVRKVKQSNNAIEARLANGQYFLKYTAYRETPLADAGWTSSKVLDFYKKNPLKGLPFEVHDPTIRLSNCIGCFNGNLQAKLHHARQYPKIIKIWDKFERELYDRRGPRNDEGQPEKGIPAGNREKTRREAIAKIRGKDDSDEREATAYASNAVPWSVIMRHAEETDPDQADDQTELDFGGCDAGMCNTDI